MATTNLPVTNLAVCVLHPDRPATVVRERFQNGEIVTYGVCHDCSLKSQAIVALKEALR